MTWARSSPSAGVDPAIGLPALFDFVPSVIWIAGFHPKGVQFYKWLANQGWDESQAIKQTAGDKGSKVHAAVEDLIAGNTVSMEAKYLNHSTERDEPLSLEEYETL
jgi:hypothetical protein